MYLAFGLTSLLPCLYHLSFAWSEVFLFHIYIVYELLSPLVLFVIGAKTLSQTELSHLTKAGNKNIATGLAWTYYYGYLKFVFPHLHETLAKAIPVILFGQGQ